MCYKETLYSYISEKVWFVKLEILIFFIPFIFLTNIKSKKKNNIVFSYTLLYNYQKTKKMYSQTGHPVYNITMGTIRIYYTPARNIIIISVTMCRIASRFQKRKTDTLNN